MKEYYDVSAANKKYSSKAASDYYSVNTGPETLTQQQFADESDVNTIVRRFGLTGNQLVTAAASGVYGDFTSIEDYESAVSRITAMQERFMALPPEFRDRFNNDPGELVRYAASVRSEDELLELERQSLPGVVVNPPPAAPAAGAPVPPATS